MHPVLTTLQLGPTALAITSYGLCLCLGLAVTALGSLWSARRAGLDLGACIAVAGTTTLGGFAGALTLHLLAQWGRLGSLTLAVQTPGMAFFGALLGAGAALLASARRLSLPALTLLDLTAPWAALGHALGRVGCLLGGCCYGVPWDGPFAVRYAHPFAPAALSSVARHPVPAYEAVLLLSLALALFLRPAPRPGSGAQALCYVSSYAVLRLGLEVLRGDAVRGLYFGARVSTSQMVALALLCAALALAVRARQATVDGAPPQR